MIGGQPVLAAIAPRARANKASAGNEMKVADADRPPDRPNPFDLLLVRKPRDHPMKTSINRQKAAVNPVIDLNRSEVRSVAQRPGQRNQLAEDVPTVRVHGLPGRRTAMFRPVLI